MRRPVDVPLDQQAEEHGEDDDLQERVREHPGDHHREEEEQVVAEHPVRVDVVAGQLAGRALVAARQHRRVAPLQRGAAARQRCAAGRGAPGLLLLGELLLPRVGLLAGLRRATPARAGPRVAALRGGTALARAAAASEPASGSASASAIGGLSSRRGQLHGDKDTGRVEASGYGSASMRSRASRAFAATVASTHDPVDDLRRRERLQRAHEVRQVDAVHRRAVADGLLQEHDLLVGDGGRRAGGPGSARSRSPTTIRPARPRASVMIVLGRAHVVGAEDDLVPALGVYQDVDARDAAPNIGDVRRR